MRKSEDALYLEIEETMWDYFKRGLRRNFLLKLLNNVDQLNRNMAIALTKVLFKRMKSLRACNEDELAQELILKLTKKVLGGQDDE